MYIYIILFHKDIVTNSSYATAFGSCEFSLVKSLYVHNYSQHT